jgi:hypothetical protein
MRNRQMLIHHPTWGIDVVLRGLLDRSAKQPLQGIGRHEGSEICQQDVVQRTATSNSRKEWLQ